MNKTNYTPRRQSPKYLDGDCPSGVLAIYDDGKSFDRYTVFYKEVITGSHGEPWIGYRGMSESPASAQGVGIYGEMEAHLVAAYRYSVGKQACKWSQLPDAVKDCVRRDLATEEC